MLRPALLSTLLLAVAAAAQPAPDVIGTWELVSAEAVPAEDSLAFARVTFTADAMDAVYVFLDPDDGELSGRFDAGRYVVSDGDLVVRDGRDVTVLEVAREGEVLSVHDVETGVVLVLRGADPGRAIDPELLGAWVGTRGGTPFAIRFGPDGVAEVRVDDDRDTVDYVVAGPYVLLGDEPARYALDGRSRLTLTAEGPPAVLFRTPD